MERPRSPKTIGYFGDSFCADPRSESWTTILAEKLCLEVVNRGKAGSSIWTAILDYNKLVDNNQVPDISIFCWTSPHRLYHPKHPISLGSLRNLSSKLADICKKFFLFLWFDEKEFLNYKYVLEHFDTAILNSNHKMFFQIFSINPDDSNISLSVNLKNNFLKDFSIIQFSGKTLDDHNNRELDKFNFNHMSVEKNSELANYFYKQIVNRQNQKLVL